MILFLDSLIAEKQNESREAEAYPTHDSLTEGLRRAVGQVTDLQTVLLSEWERLIRGAGLSKQRVNTDVIVGLTVLDTALSQRKTKPDQICRWKHTLSHTHAERQTSHQPDA